MIDLVKNRISIIVPVYNAEKYLEKCIESILGQTYDDWELLLINDGSVDASGKICDFYASKDERIKAFHQDNAGVSVARNFGIKESCGEFLTFVDSDDYITENHIEGLIKAMQEKSCDLSVADIFFKQGDKVWNNAWIRRDAVISVYNYIKIIKDDFPNVCIGGVCNKVFLNRIINHNSIFFNEEKNYSEDYMFNIAYLKFCKSVALVSQASLCYRLREEDSLSKNKMEFDKHIVFWEDLYFSIDKLDGGNETSGRWYIRIITNCISEEMQRSGSVKEISVYLKNYFKDKNKYNYIKKAKLCREYPYNISGILLKMKCFGIVVRLFNLANNIRRN